MLRHRSRTPRRRKTATASSDPSGGAAASQEELGGGGGVNAGLAGLAETLKKNVIGFITPTKEALPAIVESSESGFEDGCLTGGTVPTSSPVQEKFIGAREFFAERDARDRLASDYCYLDTPSKLRESTRRLSIRKPLNPYIAYSSDEELDEWQQQPRSDYTYSASLTYRDRVTPDRKIGSPNMARRGLKGGNLGYAGSPDFSTSDLSIVTDHDSSHLNLRTRAILRPMDVLSDTSDGEAEEVTELVTRPRRLRSSRSRSVDVVPKANGSTVTRTVTSSYTTTKLLHRGLDNESDADDGRESTVPRRATPLTARSGTPLTASRPRPPRSSASLDRAVRGYTLAEGAIAEDVQEEETQNDSFVAWRKRSWQSITRITTLITTSLVMMVVRTVGAKKPQRAPTAGSEEATSAVRRSRHSLLSTITTTRRRITTATTELLATARDAIRKKPILVWIPLLPVLILLALIATWWLLQSGGETGDSADPKQTTDGPSFLSYTLSSASQMTNVVVKGAYYGPVMVWEAALCLLSSVWSLCSSGLAALWATLAGMVTWLGSVVYSGLAYILHTLSLALHSLQILFLAVVHLFSSSVSRVSGFFLPVTAANGTEQAAESEARSWSIAAWASSLTSADWVSSAYASVSETAEASQTWLWKGWLWLVVSVADALSTAAASLLWLLGSLWSLLCFLLSGLWTVLVHTFSGVVGLFTSAAATVTFVAVETSSAVSSVGKLLFLPLFKSSGSAKLDTSKISTSPEQAPGRVEVQTATAAGVSVEEVVRKVLESAELKSLIAKVSSSQSSTNAHLTNEAVSSLVMSVVEGELRSHKAETSALLETAQSHTNTATQETKDHISSLKQQQQDLLKQLSLLGAGLAKLQGSVEADQQGLQDHHRDYDLQLAALSNKIEQLTSQLEELESNHTILASEVKSCCRNTSVTLADVEKHVTTLLGDILGLSGLAAGEQGGAAGTWSAADMGAWLRSYFVAKEELEARLHTLMAAKQKSNLEEKNMMEASVGANNAAMAQTTHTLMETVLEKLRAEIQQQHTQLTHHSREHVTQQVNLQMKAAATVLGQQVSEQLENQLQSSRQQLQESVSAAVEGAVPKHVASAVPEVVASAVSKAVATALPEAVASEVSGAVNIAVKDAVNEAVDAAVTGAIATAVPDAVNVAVPNVVAKVVAHAVPEAVEEALPEAVNAVVHEAVAAEVHGAIAVAVPEVVASVLPSAVSTAVNETVESRISEVLVDRKVNKAAGGGHIEVQGLGEEGIVVLSGTTSDKSSSGGSATLSATVNVSKNSSAGSSHFASMGIPPLAAGLNESAVIRIVKEALLKYDADKTGMVDHALESAGGNIISTRCTESYQVHQAEVSILGFPIYRYSTNNPRTIIQPDRMPGQCWAFKGSQGYIVVQLAGSVRPTGFTLEHIPKSLSPSGEIDSAPREFEVWGLHSENHEGVFLGSYEYNQDGEPLQFFGVVEANTEYFPMIELKINSNHGNLQYTCLYRFRVHGLRYF